MSQQPLVLSYSYDILLSKCVPRFNNFPREKQDFITNEFGNALEHLCELELIIWSNNEDDEDVYTGTIHTPPNDLSTVEKSIYNCLQANKTIFNTIILDCQFDKSNQTGKFIINCLKSAIDYETTKKTLPIIFLVADNFQSLADQTSAGLHKQLCSEFNIDSTIYEGLFVLKSNEKTSFNDIKNYIDSYVLSYRENLPIKKLPPIILLLNNPTQIKKMIDIHIEKVLNMLAIKSDWPLRSAFAFDEVDKVYPLLRDTFRPYIIDSTQGVSVVLGVTATEDGMIDEFPEWAESNLIISDIDSTKAANHRSINHSETDIKHYTQNSKESNNDYAMRIINQNLDYFKNARINPKNQQTYFSKTIILGNVKITEQKTLADDINKLGFHTLLYNEKNIKVKKNNSRDWAKINVTKKVLRDELFRIFNDYNLWDKPVVIIGNRKIDRGIGFHYAPPSATKGLIWTDEIMGLIDGRDANKIQKLSRLNGVIAHCEDYPNKLTFFTDHRNSVVVRNNSNINNELNKNYYAFSALKGRLEYAKENAKHIYPPDKNSAIGETDAYDEYEDAVKLIRRLNPDARISSKESYIGTESGLYETSLTSHKRPYTIDEYETADANFTESSLLDLRATGISYRLMPLHTDDSYTDVKWCVRWASKHFQCGDNITKEEVLSRKYPYRIEINESGPLIIRVERIM